MPTVVGCGKSSSLEARKAVEVKEQPLEFAEAIERGPAYAHFLIAAPNKLLEQANRQYGAKGGGVPLDEASLRAQLAAVAGPRKGVAQNIDLKQPFGCVIIDPMPHMAGPTWPGACVLGYTGGTKALIDDMGKEGKRGDAEEHAAAYDLFGRSIYVDALGDHVVLSGTPKLFAQTKGYLEKNLIARAAKHEGAELTVHANAIMKQYGPMLAPFLANAGNVPTIAAEDPKLDAIATAINEYRKKSQQETLDSLKNTEQFQLIIESVEGDLRVSTRIRTAADAPAHARWARGGFGKIDLTLLASLPSKPAAVFGTRQDIGKFVAELQRQGLFDIVQTGYEAFSGKKDDIRKELIDWSQTMGKSILGSGAFGLYGAPGNMGAAVIVQRLAPKAQMRDLAKAHVEKFPAERFGPETKNYATWKFETDVFAVQNVPVDLYTVEAGPKTIEALDAETDPSVAKLKIFLGGWKLEAYVAQVGDVAITVVAPQREKEYLEQTITAALGKGGIEADPGFTNMLSLAAGNSVAMAIDGKSMVAWVADFLGENERKELLAHPFGRDLGDLLIRLRGHEEGHFTGELRVAPHIIEQVGAIAKANQ